MQLTVMGNTGAGYECCCGFKSTRATNFLRHIKESAVLGETHRLIEADAERLAQAEHHLWHSSPEQPTQTHQVAGRQSRNGESRPAAVLNDKEGASLSYGKNRHASSSGGEAQGKHSRKRPDYNAHGDLRTTTKRRATGDGSTSVPDVNPTTSRLHGSHQGGTQGAHIPTGSVNHMRAYNTRSHSRQHADQPLCAGGRRVDITGHHLAEVQPEVEHAGRVQQDAGEGSPLPVSMAACFDKSLQAELMHRRAWAQDPPASLVPSTQHDNPLAQRYEHEAEEEPLLPDSWDAEGLAEWFVYLISWENRRHSVQGLVGGLYILAFIQELWQRVTWAPVSVVALLALFAVGHSSMPAGMPALSKLLRKAGVTDQTGTVLRASQAFQELNVTVNQSRSRLGTVWVDCKGLVAEISCTALQAVSDVAQMWEPPVATRRRSVGSARGQSAQLPLADKATAGSYGQMQGGTACLSLNEVVKAGLILLQRASYFRSASHTVAKLGLLWVLLFLSESAALSQWNCTMAAYASCFGWRACWERYGNLLEELLRAVGSVLPLLCSHHYRTDILIASSSAVAVMWGFGSVALVPRITAASATGLVCLVWQLQRRHRHMKQQRE